MRQMRRFCTILAGILAGSALPAAATLLTASDSTWGTADDAALSRNLPIGVDGIVDALTIRIDFAKCDDPAMKVGQTKCASLAEEFAAEIFLYLTSPAGRRVDLVYTRSNLAEGIEQGSTRRLGTYPNTQNTGRRVQVTFDDHAAALVGPVMTTGSFRPEEPLSAFVGDHAQGTWVLHAGDTDIGDPLSYFSASLEVTVADAAARAPAVPAPPVVWLLAGGVAALTRSRQFRAP